MVSNLLHNAIVHNWPQSGLVLVTTCVQDETAILSVQNTGDELTPHLVATLLEPFRRGRERIQSDHAGVGLGLAIVKSIVLAHDGQLQMMARPSGGLIVKIQLPTAAPRGETGHPRATHDPVPRARA